MARRSLFRAALTRPDRLALGTWVKLPAMESVEVMAHAGFDFVVIDLEHSAMSAETVHRHIGVALLAGLSPIVRVPSLADGLAQRLLDAGADGIMLPHVDTVEQAEAAVDAIRFPPRGSRGVGSTARAGSWGMLPRDEYIRFGQEEVVLIAQLESADAAKNAAAIAAVPGVDALLVGTADLSTSEGMSESDPHVVALVTGAVDAARAAGVPIGNAGAATASAAQTAAAAGFSFTMMSNDASMLASAAIAAVTAGRTARRATDDRNTELSEGRA